MSEVFKTGPFKGVSVDDAFAKSASKVETVVVALGDIAWPEGLAPTPAPLGGYAPGTKITEALNATADVLIILYTDYEIQALLDVFTGDNDWSEATSSKWCGYAHNFATFEPDIRNIGGDKALENGMFGYLSCVKIGTKTVVLYKTELHPKQNGPALPFIPVIKQLVGELQPGLVISTGTAGAVGPNLNCGDVAITNTARFHCQLQYPDYPEIDTMTANDAAIASTPLANTNYVQYAAANYTRLSLDGLAQCYTSLQKQSGYGFVAKNMEAPSIYVEGTNAVAGPEPMAIVSADYLSVDDNLNSEGLQTQGIMNDTDDAFAFYAIGQLPGAKPAWLSVRNASEPQIVVDLPAGTPTAEVNSTAKGIAGSVYGIYQYCTTLNSAFACWGIVAGL